jgi:hypothetical protein
VAGAAWVVHWMGRKYDPFVQLTTFGDGTVVWVALNTGTGAVQAVQVDNRRGGTAVVDVDCVIAPCHWEWAPGENVLKQRTQETVPRGLRIS